MLAIDTSIASNNITMNRQPRNSYETCEGSKEQQRSPEIIVLWLVQLEGLLEARQLSIGRILRRHVVSIVWRLLRVLLRRWALWWVALLLKSSFGLLLITALLLEYALLLVLRTALVLVLTLLAVSSLLILHTDIFTSRFVVGVCFPTVLWLIVCHCDQPTIPLPCFLSIHTAQSTSQ